jgi:DNA-binding MarR family transcriptional regulator
LERDVVPNAGENLDRDLLAEASRVCACFNFRKASRAVTQLFDSVLQPAGLRSTQFVVLVAIQAEGAMELPDLARALNVDRSTLTRNLQPLARAGLLRIAGGRSRASSARLTPKGRRALAAAIPLWEVAQARFVEQLGGRRWESMLKGLHRVVDAAHEA